MKHLGDITKLSGYVVPPVDIITGGSPCQDLSVAGKRAGLAGERSGLFMDQIRIIKEMRENDKRNGRANDDIRPRYMVWENVPGAFSSNKGEDFRAVLEETAKVADSNAVIPRPANGKWAHAGCILGDGWSIAWRLHDAQFWGVPQRRKRIALVADFRGGGAPEILFERESVSGNIETSAEQKQGTATNIKEGIGKTSGIYDVIQQPTCLTRRFSSVNIYDDGVTPTLEAGAGEGGNNMPMIMETYQKTTGALMASGYDKLGTQEAANDMYVVQNVMAMQAIGEYKQSETASSLKMRDYKDATDLIVSYTSIVRRLTPLECERLQGFPDGWTDIGEWIDSKGKKHKDADSPRYKALGNSIALPFWEWMAERMIKQLNKDKPTMASLFDGIGGFPLVYSRHGCEPVWASEIEEFPMAVTERRFNG